MIDIKKQVVYWKIVAIEDWEVAQELVSSGKGRYPDALLSPPSQGEASDYLCRAEEVYQWLMNQL